MSKDINEALETAAIQVLRPLIRVLLRNGLACGEVEEMLRKVYVDQAFILAKQEGKATISSVSAKTGLSRKEVKRLVEMPEDTHHQLGHKYNRAIRVISGWLNDPRFVTAEGIARTLSFEGEASFAELVKDYSGDIPTRAMLDLLEKSGCVEKLENRIHLISHAYVPGNDPVDIIDILGTDTKELMETITHNMHVDKQHKRFQRKVSTHQLDSQQLEAFQKYANRRSQVLLEDLDNWLSEHQAEHTKDEMYVSVGVYFYEQHSGLEEDE